MLSDKPTAIEISHLSKHYQSRDKKIVQAVDNLNLSVQAGQVFGFLGANGAGKTTTIKMICGLVKPDAGTITVNGYDVARQHSQAMRQIGAVLEGTRNIYWRLTALENILYFGRLKGIWGKILNERAEALLNELELWDRRNDKVRTFSRGMQQKVAIACALISNPPIVLLDEPTLGLDVKAALTVKNWIAKIAREEAKTIILTTHQLDMAQELCHRIAIINKGKMLTNQPTRELLDVFRKEFYEIRFRGQLNGSKGAFEQNFTVHEDGETTLLSGAINSQDELFALLNRLRELKLPLVSVSQAEPNLEEIFINYTEGVVS